MQDTSRVTIESLIEKQRAFFASGKTRDIGFRLEMLKRLKNAILKHEKNIAEAFWTDLHKSYEEAYLTEIGIVLGEIDYHIQNITKWAKSKRIRTPLVLQPSSSRIFYEPLGVTLIMAPWNYPFMLLMDAVVGAISSGCTAILKPSPYTSGVALAMEEMIAETFAPEYLAMVQGSRKVNETLLEQRFDFIFFTGSPQVGKVVMKAAAENLTPVVLELGGKSPCIVEKDADIKVAARRIAFGKCINAGQTCIAPDYLFVHEAVKDKLLRLIGEYVNEMYGNDRKNSAIFPHIVNEQAFDRLEGLMKHGKIIFGGEIDRTQKFIDFTIIDNIKPDYPVMQEEIFGPILPVLSFTEIEEVVSYVNKNEKPLAFYFFGKNKSAKKMLLATTSGGGCINDTLMHFVDRNLPFGGVGNSGLGKYHGKFSFLAFSNQRAIVKTPTWIDLPFKYAPFKYFKMMKKLL
ncbi:MAG TPA: aldehyde dehydrogenase [Prolixibacteraceae bacterium]|nr:aldehyde dehydrogenase [Prolixibacteraceae bacterium]